MAEPAAYNQTVPATPIATPSTTSVFDTDVNMPLVRELVVSKNIQEPQLVAELNIDQSYFTGANLLRLNELTSNLKAGQKIRVDIEKDQDPLALFQKEALSYKTIDDCHEALDLNCEVPCINTLPAFEYVEVCFDTEYAYGVRACDKNTAFWTFDMFTKQYAKSRSAMKFGQALDVWNNTITELVTTPAVTVDEELKTCHPTHFWEGTTVTADGRDLITRAYNYMADMFGITPNVFMPEEVAHELIMAEETLANRNFATQRVNTYKNWEIPGFKISSSVEEILGGQIPVRIMNRNAWMRKGTDYHYPLFNKESTKQYVAILDPRVAYFLSIPGYHLEIKPYDCDKLYRGMIDTEYTATGVTFPTYGLIISFDKLACA